MNVERLLIGIGALSGMMAVMAGAFAAHALEHRVSERGLEVFQLAATYQMYHALAMIAAGWAAGRWGGRLAPTAGWLFLAGTAVFCGSLYALGLSGVGWLGAITPIGGVCFLLGWLALAAGALFERDPHAAASHPPST